MFQIQSAVLSVQGRRGLVAAVLGCSVLAAIVNGCVSQMTCETPLDPCVQSGGPAEAAVTAAAAGALWVGGGGCAIAGCRPPYVCNTGSGLCEHMACGEGARKLSAGNELRHDDLDLPLGAEARQRLRQLLSRISHRDDAYSGQHSPLDVLYSPRPEGAALSNVVNLNKFRKRKAKTAREKRADVNRRLHGRTKVERAREDLQQQRLTRVVDGARLDPPRNAANDSGDEESSTPD